MLSAESLQIQSCRFNPTYLPSAPGSLAEGRAWFDVMVENYAGHPIPLPEGTRVESVKVDGIPAEWIYPPGADAERAVLFLHGGAYILGSLKSHRDLVARLSRAAGVRSLLTDYRLAPEHVFPAALDDALTAYRWLLARGTRPRHIVLAGDSAGGGLALALLESLRDETLPMSAGAVLLSPWTDLVGRVASRITRNASDPIFTGIPLFDITPLKKTLSRYVDFDILKTSKKRPRLIVTCTDIQTSNPVIYDSKNVDINVENVVASAGFPFYGISWTQQNNKGDSESVLMLAEMMNYDE
jgi:hypothetical protein